ncbi:protein prenylyltransferase [Auricularia subglabra TFB-10046 SS5]|nr:protein prenylyltransferase [Auricularia subglabra TFB-10046 SS5]
MTRTCYDTLADVLASLESTGAIEIEIVPSAALLPDLDPNPHAPFIFIDGHLGVPKKALYQAYLDACRVFGAPGGDILRATAVILLANPAHSTALNARKKLVMKAQRDPRLELVYTASLLSEQQASKSSFLWHHRRWLLHSLYTTDKAPFSDDLEARNDIPRDVLQSELELAERACEVYPRNYFAWKHRRYCARHLADLTQELDTIHNWLDRHVSDYSAVHHVCTIVRPGAPAGLVTKNFDHALSLVAAYPGHETLWLFLRTARLSCDHLELRVRQSMDEQMGGLLFLFGVDYGAKHATGGLLDGTSRRPTHVPDDLPEHAFAARCAQWLELARGS